MKFKKYIIFVFIVIFSVGCFPEYHSQKKSSSKRDVNKDANKVYDAIMKKVELNQDPYIYPDHKLPDPFMTIFDGKSEAPAPVVLTGIKNSQSASNVSDLQRFDLDELTLVGLVYGTTSNDRRALLKDPTGKTHNVRERAFVGKDSGRISSIKKDRIIINVESTELSGKRIVDRIPIKLETEE